MYKSLIIAKNFILQVSKNKINFLIYVLLPPILAIVFMFAISSGNSQTIPIGITDLDNSHSSLQIIKYINDNNKYEVQYYNDNKSLINDITNRNIRAGIFIRKGFEKSLIEKEPIKVELYSIEGATVLGWLDNFINSKISSMREIAFSPYYYEILDNYENKYIALDVTNVNDVSNKMEASQAGFGIFIFASIFSIWAICMLAFKEKILKTYQRILISPITHIQYVMGNVIASMSFALMHMVISIPIIYLIFDIKNFISIGNLIILMFALYASVITLGVLLVSLGKRQNSLMAINVLVLTITSMLGGCYWSIEFMPQFMQNIGKITPQYWFNAAIINLSKNESIYLNVIVLMSFAIIYLLIYIIILKLKKDKRYI